MKKPTAKDELFSAIGRAESLEQLAGLQQRARRLRHASSATNYEFRIALEKRRRELSQAAGEDVCQECGNAMDDAAIERDAEADFCSKCQRTEQRFEEDWRRERATEAGMAFGIAAYNEVMGWD